MLFGIVYRERNPTEEGQKRSLGLFTNWEPPIEFKGHWFFPSGGGMALVETDNPAALLEAMAPYTPYLEFRFEPAIPAEEGVEAFRKANAWRDSVT